MACAVAPAPGRAVADGLYSACARGDGSRAAALLWNGADPNPAHAPWLDTPLAAAVRRGDVMLVRSLLAAGAHPWSGSAEGQPVLVLASALGRVRSAALLLAAGANPRREVRPPVSRAFLRLVSLPELRDALRHDSGVTPLMLACAPGRFPLASCLLHAGADADLRTHTARLGAIDLAATRHDVRLMRLLLGCDPSREARQILIRRAKHELTLIDTAGNEVLRCTVAVGSRSTPTPLGEFVITNKYARWTSTRYGIGMPYFQRLNGGEIGLHQGPVDPGQESHGCIRLPEGAALRLFGMTAVGDRVTIVP